MVGLNRSNLDLANSVESLARAISGSEIVVNAVGYTRVDLAESEYESAEYANVEVPGKLAEACLLAGSRLIHISTDYVFDGQSETPYLTSSQRNPSSVYGRTKLAGEDVVLGFKNTQVVRTAWLYGANGPCFPKSIAARLLSGDDIRVVDDQFGSPTNTMDLADFIVRIGSEPLIERVLHGVSSGSTSWFGFALEIAKALNISEGLVQPSSTANYPTQATRPAHSVLKPSSAGGHQIPHWQKAWWAHADQILTKSGITAWPT